MTVDPHGVVAPPPAADNGASAWDHLTALGGGIGAIALGYFDLRNGAVLTQAVDGALLLAGFGLLGVKGVTGALPRA